jgi:hypothetical protein
VGAAFQQLPIGQGRGLARPPILPLILEIHVINYNASYGKIARRGKPLCIRLTFPRARVK